MAPAGGLCQGAYLKEALRRYEQLWLPLLASQRRAGGAWQQLVPPLDVAFIWHLHRLHPSAYETDCAAVLELPGANLHVTPEQVCSIMWCVHVNLSGGSRTSRLCTSLPRQAPV